MTGPGRPDPADVLGRAEYMLLTTFRRDGTPVPTPVWVMPADPDWPGTAGDQLWVWTNPTSGKVKRLRRDGACEVVPCTTRGYPRGRSVPAIGRVLPESSVPRVLDALVRKYGIRGRLSTLGPRWGLSSVGVLGIRLVPAAPVAAVGPARAPQHPE
ncbi:PPOX class F420-dependent oxidoreductase [Nakamurella sp.]|uniref:PPOX class F420-dependent oxidoreductase n=1 Tax=Nakamurella sp. TaxID=1869182 RepID=UPI003B3B1EDD